MKIILSDDWILYFLILAVMMKSDKIEVYYKIFTLCKNNCHSSKIDSRGIYTNSMALKL